MNIFRLIVSIGASMMLVAFIRYQREVMSRDLYFSTIFIGALLAMLLFSLSFNNED